jgi:hypothetical protein
MTNFVDEEWNISWVFLALELFDKKCVVLEDTCSLLWGLRRFWNKIMEMMWIAYIKMLKVSGMIWLLLEGGVDS